MNKKAVEYLNVALRLSGIQSNKVFAELVALNYELVQRKGGRATLEDSVKIKCAWEDRHGINKEKKAKKK